MESWYSLRSKPRKENVLWKQVEARGFETFFPSVMMLAHGSRAIVRKPYFPGYMFVRTDIDKVGISTFRWMPYSIGLVCFGGEPAYVPDSLIHAIRKRLEHYQKDGSQARSDFHQGESVRIEEGLFEGFSAIFDQHIGGQERVKVLLELLSGRHVLLELNPSQLVKLTRD